MFSTISWLFAAQPLFSRELVDARLERRDEASQGRPMVSKTLEKPLWRDTTIIRENVIESVRALKAQPGGSIVTECNGMTGEWRSGREGQAW